MNKDHNHIQVPRLGQVPTNGNRFQAILKAAAMLRRIQESDRADDMQVIQARRRLAWGYTPG